MVTSPEKAAEETVTATPEINETNSDIDSSMKLKRSVTAAAVEDETVEANTAVEGMDESPPKKNKAEETASIDANVGQEAASSESTEAALLPEELPFAAETSE